MSAPRLRIREASTSLYRVPTSVFAPRALTDTTHRIDALEIIVVQLSTEDGGGGLGYAYTTGHGGQAVRALIDQELVPLYVGRDAAEKERLWEEAWWRTHWVGRGGVSALSTAAMDLAVWDALARAADLPLHRYIGAYRDEVPWYGSGVDLDDSLQDLRATARRFVTGGCDAIKIKVGRQDLQEDLQRLRVVREVLGPGGRLMVDANMGWSLPEARRRARAMEPLDVYWLEEPLVPEDVAGHAQLARVSAIPLAAGENLYSRYAFADYLAAGALSVAQPDVLRCGGVTEWLRIAHLAAARGVPVAPHFCLELHTALLCAIPNALVAEYLPWFDPLLVQRVDTSGGRARPLPGPGHGVRFDWGLLERYRAG